MVNSFSEEIAYLQKKKDEAYQKLRENQDLISNLTSKKSFLANEINDLVRQFNELVADE